MVPDTSRWSSYPEQLFLLFLMQLGVFVLAVAGGSLIGAIRRQQRLRHA